MSPILSRTLFRAALLLALVNPAAAAQADSLGHRDKTLFTGRDLALAGGFAALTIAMLPLDRSVALRLQDSSNQSNRFLKNATRDIQFVADPASIVIGVSLYGVGRVGQWREIADLGLHGTEAILLSGAVTGALKALAGRARPSQSGGSDPDYFKFFGGISDGAFQSFPSGHTTAAFAAASAVTSESRRWWPEGTWLVAPAMYGGATLVGLSRMYNNAHWASDVALGAGIGTFAGLKVVRYSHTHRDNFIDRALLSAQVLPERKGEFLVGWSVVR